MKKFNSFVFNIRPTVRTWDRAMVAGLSELIDNGIAYWAESVSGCDDADLPLLFQIIECETLIGNDEPKTHNIDLATLASGINRILSGECPINTRSIGNIAAFVATNDLQHIDGEDADLIVQAGLYNDIKWG